MIPFSGYPGSGWLTRRLNLDGGAVQTSQPVLRLKQLWSNPQQAFTAATIDITDRGSLASSLAVALAVNGAVKIQVSPYGSVDFPNSNGDAIQGIYFSGSRWIYSTSGYLACSGVNGLWGVQGVLLLGSGGDLFLVRDSANVGAFRFGTNANAFRVYRTYTNASNYERVTLDAGNTTANLFILRAEAAGTGTLRPLYVRTGTTTVGALVAASTVGAGTICHVTDATSTTPRSIAAGGGANFCQVMSNGTNWLIVA